MRFVTISDHRTLEGALRIAHLPDTFFSVEVRLGSLRTTSRFMSSFGISERTITATSRPIEVRSSSLRRSFASGSWRMRLRTRSTGWGHRSR